MTAPKSNTAERVTPAGEAMREAVARVLWGELTVREQADAAVALFEAGLARLTAERDEAQARENKLFCAGTRLTVDLGIAQQDVRWFREQHAAAEAALTTIRAEHAAEIANAAARARRDALEEAAKVCDLRVSVWRHHIGKPSQTDMDEQVASLFENAAQAIRALVANTPEPTP